MTSNTPMKKNTACRIVFPILDTTGKPLTGATGADSEVSLDGGNFGDITDEVHEIATNSGIYYLDLTAGETNGDVVAIQTKVSNATGTTTVLVFYTAGQTFNEMDTVIDDILIDVGTAITDIGAIPTNPILATEDGSSFTAIPAPADMALDSTVAKESTLGAPAVSISADIVAIPTNPMLDTENGSSFVSIPGMATQTSIDDIPSESNFKTLNATALGDISDGIWTRASDGTFTTEDLLKIVAAILGGKTTITVTAPGVATVVFRDLSDTVDKVTAEVEGSERTSVVII
jgi:hypothetical protein